MCDKLDLVDCHGATKNAGFTLLEILLVVAAISTLAGIVVIAIDPAGRLAEARDTQRHSDVRAILSAIVEYTNKNQAFPESFPTGDVGVCETEDGASICTAGGACPGFELADALVPDFISALPVDPSLDAAGQYTGYNAYTLPGSTRIVVCAPLTEKEAAPISVAQ